MPRRIRDPDIIPAQLPGLGLPTDAPGSGVGECCPIAPLAPRAHLPERVFQIRDLVLRYPHGGFELFDPVESVAVRAVEVLVGDGVMGVGHADSALIRRRAWIVLHASGRSPFALLNVIGMTRPAPPSSNS